MERTGTRAKEVIGQVTVYRRREALQDSHGDRRQPAHGNQIARKGCASRTRIGISCRWVVNLAITVSNLAEVLAQIAHARCRCAGAENCGSRNSYVIGDPVGLAGSLVIAKDEQLILYNGPARRAPKLIPLRMGQWLVGRLVEGIARLRGIGVPEPKGASMDIIGAGLR